MKAYLLAGKSKDGDTKRYLVEYLGYVFCIKQILAGISVSTAGM